jgi:hyperosmotically inducible protein
MKMLLRLILITFCLSFLPVYAAVSDTSIVADIQKKLQDDPNTANLKVLISSNKGIIILSGDLATDVQLSSLIEDVQSVNGVIDIDTSKLNVQQSKQKFTDVVVTSKVKGLFLREKIFGNKLYPEWGINIETTDGVVYLTGVMDNAAQLEKALTLVNSVNGVKEVQAKLTTTR